ncbi:MAG: adenylosuccinate synthase [Thermoanaerobaculales bacterium]|nr:adenylosuccinate synthase [Thermoanaerobaculales bacterium]
MARDSLMIIGGQWGDEGKGKVVDLLSAGFAAVVRYNGGNNAGHTVRYADRRFALHLVPSGIIHDGVTCYLASGMVVDPSGLVAEMDTLMAEGVAIDGRIVLSPRATLILPTHRALDGAREGTLGSGKIGTTGRGIGPAYQDRAQRRGLRAHVLADPQLRARALALMQQHNRELELLFDAAPVDLDDALAELEGAAARLAPTLGEVGPALRRHRAAGEAVLFEGAQGVMLDLAWGTYPYVTSSSSLPGFAAASCGIGPKLLGPVIGVMKAYATRVGGGPFPSELEDEVGVRLRERGAEYGTTTGRPRRCGWFDAVAARFAVEVAGIDAVALTKLDVLDGLETIRVATAYRLPDGTTIDTFPADAELAEQAEPVLTELEGWSAPTAGVVREAELPPAAAAYLRFLEETLGLPIVILSTGPRREETLIRGDSALARELRALIAGDAPPAAL